MFDTMDAASRQYNNMDEGKRASACIACLKTPIQNLVRYSDIYSMDAFHNSIVPSRRVVARAIPSSFPALVLISILGILFFLSGCLTTGWTSETGLQRPESPESRFESVGEVTVERVFWNVLFLKSPEERRSVLLDDARRHAKREYGSEARVAAPVYDSRWSALSLLLGLDMIGFVERAEVTVEVFLPVVLPVAPIKSDEAPSTSLSFLPNPPVISKAASLPLPEVAPAYHSIVTYSILPQERYRDGFGYIELEYRTFETVKEAVTVRLTERDADREEYAEKYAEIPEGGYVVVHIGRQDLMHANTRWYSYRILTAGSVLLFRKGKEGIPNVRGRDGNWWNEVRLPLRTPIESAIDVTVTDERTGAAYDFMVRKSTEMIPRGDAGSGD
jgi:hypothetical protein